MKFVHLLWVVLGLIIIMLIVMIQQQIEIQDNKEEFMEFNFYMIDVMKFCAKSNNITYQELLDDYIRNFTETIIMEDINK